MVQIMRTSKLLTLTIVLLLSILSSQQYQLAHAETVPIESKALAYVTNVLPFNMSHYTINVSNAYSLPSAPNNPTITQAVEMNLNSSDSTIHVVCLYVNGALSQCSVTLTSGSPVSDRTYSNLEDVAARILQAHQEQTGLDSTNLLNTLNLLNSNAATIVTFGDVNLSVSQFPDIIGPQTINGMPVPVASNSSFSITFDWTLIQNGAPSCLVSLTFDNGIFCNLQDNRATQLTAGINPNADLQQENSTAQSFKTQSTNGTSPQTNQLQSKPSQKTTDVRNELAIPILIAAIAAYITVVIAVLTYKSKSKIN
jgi:hypothetical protein